MNKIYINEIHLSVDSSSIDLKKNRSKATTCLLGFSVTRFPGEL